MLARRHSFRSPHDELGAPTIANEQERRRELGEAPIGRLLIRYSAPAIVGMSVNALYNLVDAAFVGKGVGTLALAGLTISFPIQMLTLGIAQLVGIGASSIVSRALGAGDQRQAERAAGTSSSLAFALGIVLCVVGLIWLHPILRLFGATDEVLPFAADYMRIIFIGCAFFTFAISANNLMRSEGAVRAAMFAMIVGCVLNIILDPIFIFVLDMGISGAALATIIGQAVSFVYLIAFYVSGRSILKIQWADLRPHWASVPEMLAIGSSAFVRVIAGSLVFIALNHSVARYGNNVHLAIMGVVNRLVMFAFLPVLGLSHGLQPILGFNYGARNLSRVMRALRLATLGSSAMAVGGCALLTIWAPHMVSIFSSDAQILAEGPAILRTLVCMFALVGFQVVAVCLFQSIGKAGPALILSCFRQIFAQVPLILLLPLWMGLSGVWLAFPLADALSAVLTAILLVREVRRLAEGLADGRGAPPEAVVAE